MNQQCPRCSAGCRSEDRFCQSCGYQLHTYSTPAQAVPAGAIPAGAIRAGQVAYPGYRPIPKSRYEKAPLGDRFWASVLDGLIGLGLTLPTLICFLFAMQKSNDYDSYDRGGAAMLILLGFFFYLLPLTYSLIKDGLGQGQSWGKRNMYLMVVDVNDNKPCTIGQSMGRNIISTLICLVPFIGWLVEPIIVLSSADGRKLGDQAACTQVIHLDQYDAPAQY
ncbi:MAG TPA: RDD family protein [Chitinophagaceae bacterium]|nr:RDD family protein [Chitinophagaceae bacterium]